MGKKIYVGNLSYDTTDSDLQELFGQYGTVASAQVISDRETGRSKGFGFVEMATDDDAASAINALNGQQHGGRTLTVNEARPKEDRGERDGVIDHAVGAGSDGLGGEFGPEEHVGLGECGDPGLGIRSEREGWLRGHRRSVHAQTA